MSKLKALFKDTVIYGMSSIIGRFLNYMLVPLYTAHMTAESGNYGIVTNVYSWTALLLVLLIFGFETTFFRFANKQNENPDRVFSMSLQVVGAISIVFLALVFVFLPEIANALEYSDHPEFVAIMAVVVAQDAVQAMLFSFLRFQKRAIKFASLKLLFIFTSILLNLFAFLLLPDLAVSHPDTFGALYSPNNQALYVFAINLICTSFITLFFIPELKHFRFTADKKLLAEMLKYSWPLLLLGLAGILNLNADKIIYTKLVPGIEGKIELSIYGAAVKVAAIMTLLMQAFRYAYEPLVFSDSKDKDSKKLYAATMKYFIIVSLLAFLGVVFYMDIIRYIISPDYWDGLKVVPLVMAGEVFMGIYFNLSFWYKLNDETYWGAIFSFLGCAALFAINILFVPTYGYMACGCGSMAGYGIAMVLSYIVGQRRNPIGYDLKAIGKYVLLFALLYGTSMLLPIENSWVKMGVNTLLMAVYIGYAIKHDFPIKKLLRRG